MANAKGTAPQSTEVETRRMLSTEQLRDITDFESAVALLQSELGATVISSDILGDGFTLLENKDELIGKPLMFVSWVFSLGDFLRDDGTKGEFVSARIVAQMGPKDFQKYVIVDGGTGIYAQLKDIDARQDGAKVLTAPRGLRKSEYEHPIHGHGTTYYIDTAAQR